MALSSSTKRAPVIVLATPDLPRMARRGRRWHAGRGREHAAAAACARRRCRQMRSSAESALSGVSVRRCSSLNQSICSRLAPGMNRLVNIWRKNGSSWPQPWRISTEIASRLAISAALPRARHPRTYPPQITRPATFSGWRSAYSTDRAQPCEIPSRTKRSRPSRLHDTLEIVDESLEGNVLADRVGKTVQAAVVADEREAAGQRIDPVAPYRALPIEVEMRHPVRGPHDRRAGSADGIGDAGAVAALDVAYLLLAGRDERQEAGSTCCVLGSCITGLGRVVPADGTVVIGRGRPGGRRSSGRDR